MRDWSVRVFLQRVWGDRLEGARSWAVDPALDSRRARAVGALRRERRRGADDGVPGRARATSSTCLAVRGRGAVSRPTRPYVGLDYFLEEDAGLFFGRDAERKRIIGNLRASRLTLLYAESGVGQELAAARRRVGPAPAARGAQRRRAGRRATSPWSSARGRATPRPTLIDRARRPRRGRCCGTTRSSRLRRDAPRSTRSRTSSAAVDATPLVILDQFEERFLYDDRRRRLRRRARALHQSPRPAGELPDLRPRGRLLADRPSIQGAASRTSTATTCISTSSTSGPRATRSSNPSTRSTGASPRTRRASRSSPRSWTPCSSRCAAGASRSARTRRRTRRRGDGVRVETAYLQLVMKRLWDEEIDRRLAACCGSRRCGGWAARTRSSTAHLDDVMAELPDDQRDAAAAAFRFLVTSGGRKIALSSDGAARVLRRPGGAAGAGARAPRARAHPAAGPRIGAGRRGPPRDLPRRPRAGDPRLAAAPRRGAGAAGGRPEAGGGPRARAAARGAQPPPGGGGDRARRGDRRARPVPARSRVAAAPRPPDRRRAPRRAGRPHPRSPGGAHRGGRRDAGTNARGATAGSRAPTTRPSSTGCGATAPPSWPST